MAWVRLDDHFDEHAKFERVGPLAGWLFVVSLAYAGRNLTDGFIPERAVARLANWEGIALTRHGERYGLGEDVTAAGVAAALCEVGLWERTDGGYQIHDYLDYQPSKAKVLGERDAARGRMAQRRSAAVRANTNGTSSEVTVDFAHSSAAPYPVPDPINPDPGPDRARSPSTAGGRDRTTGRRRKPTAADYATTTRGGVIYTSLEQLEAIKRGAGG